MVEDFVSRVAPGVARVSLPHPHHLATQVYVLTGPPCALVDSGHFSAAAQERLAEGLARLGVAPEQIDTIFLTDASPGRLGGVLAGRFPNARVVAHPGLAAHGPAYPAYNLAYRKAYVTPLFSDPRLYRRVSFASLDGELRAAFQTGGAFRVGEPAPLGGYLRLGALRVHCEGAPGAAATGVAYRLEPGGLLFSGDLGAWGASPPVVLGELGGSVAAYLATAARLVRQDAALLLPACGGPLRPAAWGLRRAAAVVGQARSAVRGHVTGAPRSLAALLDMFLGGAKPAPLALAGAAAALTALLADLEAAGEVVSVNDEEGLAYRLGPAALEVRRRTLR